MGRIDGTDVGLELVGWLVGQVVGKSVGRAEGLVVLGRSVG